MTTTRTSGSGATARGRAGLQRTIGSRLRKARELRGIPQTKLGKLIGTSSNQVSMIESGHSGTSVHTMIAAAAALDVSMDFLAGRVDATAPMRELVRSLAEKDAAIHDLRSSVPKGHAGNLMGQIEVMETGKFTEPPRSRQWSEAKPMVRFPTTWLRENGLKPLKCRLAKVVGKGMEPTLAEGRRIIVDLTTTRPKA